LEHSRHNWHAASQVVKTKQHFCKSLSNNEHVQAALCFSHNMVVGLV